LAALRWNEKRHGDRSRGAPRRRPPTDGAGLAALRWNEKRHGDRSRGAPRRRPPTDGAGLAALVTMTATTIAIPAKRGAARSEWLTLFRRLARRRTALFGLVVVALVFAAALGAPWLSPWDPIEQDITNRLKPPGSPDPSGREREFVQAAQALGSRDGGILLRHILPNAFTPWLVVATLDMARVIVIESALSFLGLGVQPPTPTWGGMLADGRVYISTAWWL